MSLLTKIVKAISVVDDSSAKKPHPPAFEFGPGIVIKRSMVEDGVPIRPTVIPNKDSYVEELNKIKVEISKAKEELKALGRDLRDETLKAEKEAEQGVEQTRQSGEQVRQDKEAVQAAQKQATEIIAKAEAQRDKILKEAKAEGLRLADQAKNDGYLEGFSKGFEEATEEFKKENTPKAVKIADILDELSEFRERTMHDNEENLIQLAMTIARKILCRQLESDPAAVVDMLRGVVEENSREEYVKITLSPDLSQIKAKAGKDVRKLLEAIGANITVITDNDAGQGSAVVETPKGIVDVSIQTQLDNLGAVIRGQ